MMHAICRVIGHKWTLVWTDRYDVLIDTSGPIGQVQRCTRERCVYRCGRCDEAGYPVSP